MTEKTYALPKSKVGLGVEARDVISGVTGVVTSILFKLSGSIMLGLQPKGDGEKMPEAWTIDEQIVEPVDGGRTIPILDAGAPLVALGHKVVDRLSAFKGTVTGIVIHVNGCVSVIVTSPKLNSEGATIEEYFDQKRLKITGAGVSVEAPAAKRAPTKATGGFPVRARSSC